MKLHIHNPAPIEVLEITPNKELDRFGRSLIYTDCCKKRRLTDNCEMWTYEWYSPLILCKKNKGCKRG